MKLFEKLFDKEQSASVKTTQPRGFIDFETGKRVDIDLATRKEVEVF